MVAVSGCFLVNRCQCPCGATMVAYKKSSLDLGGVHVDGHFFHLSVSNETDR